MIGDDLDRFNAALEVHMDRSLIIAGCFAMTIPVGLIIFAVTMALHQ